MALMRLLLSSAVTQVSVGYKIASRSVVKVPVFATHGICISTYATPGVGQGIGRLTDFSFPIARPTVERLAESKKVYANYENAIEEHVAAERKLTMKKSPYGATEVGYNEGHFQRSVAIWWV
jgi:hypothetical protein